MPAINWEQPGLWLVKLVQAAVAAGAEDVRISLRRKAVTVKFRRPDSWNAVEILEYVISGEQPGSDSLFHLCTGVRASVVFPGESVSWICGDKDCSFERLLDQCQDASVVHGVCSDSQSREPLAESFSAVEHLRPRTNLFHWPHPMMTSILGRAMFGAQGALFAGLTSGIGLVPFVLWLGGMPKAVASWYVRRLLRRRLEALALLLAEPLDQGTSSG